MLDGYKTYLVAAVVIATGVQQYFVEGVTLAEAALYVLNGTGLATLRHGVAGVSKKL
jgi:hypothetical protein